MIRRVWAPVGKRPVAHFKRDYKWTYLYGFVRPESGEVYWLILPTVNVKLFSMALDEFAKEVGAGKKRRILLVVDQAGWHTGKEVEEVLMERCVQLLDQTEVIRDLTNYHWWPQAA